MTTCLTEIYATVVVYQFSYNLCHYCCFHRNDGFKSVEEAVGIDHVEQR